ncbi:adenine nucleotide transporter [Cristinia sonorae]|uniref:Adenine nucleotide transporter n=1 Tax=Cristinia sonorae TaxID=1940300 RepID=A0A8K0XQ90_9AGAR|nr:adenine nucleotide transporter [Cristinia sonorae]
MSGSKPTQLTPFSAAFAGALGGCFSNAVVYPLDVVKTRIQASAGGSKSRRHKLSMMAVFMKILKEEGIGGFYRGFGATMLNTFSMQYAYFFFYSFVRTSYIKRLTAKLPRGSKAPPLSTAAELLLGAVAGALAQIFTIPVSVIATRQQVGSPEKRAHKARRALKTSDIESSESSDSDSETKVEEKYDDSFIGVAKEIIEEEGVGGLWLGIKPGLVLTVNPAITYGMYERVKTMVMVAQAQAGDTSGKMSPWISFFVGAVSKSLATIVTYPYIMAKVRIQARTADAEEAKEEHLPKPHPHEYHHTQFKHTGALDILGRVWKKEGFLGWYQGMGAQIFKAVLSQALLFLSKEQFEAWTLAFSVFLWTLRQSTSV